MRVVLGNDFSKGLHRIHVLAKNGVQAVPAVKQTRCFIAAPLAHEQKKRVISDLSSKAVSLCLYIFLPSTVLHLQIVMIIIQIKL